MRIPSITKHAVAVLVLALVAGSVPAHAQNNRYDQERYRTGVRADVNARYDRNGQYDANGQYDRSGRFIGARGDVNARFDRNGRYDTNGQYDRSGRFIGSRIEASARYDRNGRANPNGQYNRSGRYIGSNSVARAGTRNSTYAFRSQPRMTMVPGTRVYVVDRNYTNPNYDVLQYGNTYYVYNNRDWYAARTWRGPFVRIDDAVVPMAFHRVSAEHWRNYPSDWTDTNADYGFDNTRTYVQPPRIAFRSEPRMRMVPGTRVYAINRAYTNTDYDMFRYGDTYYLYSDGNWFAARSWRGPFVAVDDREVPVAFQSVPREEWRSYPSDWMR